VSVVAEVDVLAPGAEHFVDAVWLSEMTDIVLVVDSAAAVAAVVEIAVEVEEEQETVVLVKLQPKVVDSDYAVSVLVGVTGEPVVHRRSAMKVPMEVDIVLPATGMRRCLEFDESGEVHIEPGGLAGRFALSG